MSKLGERNQELLVQRAPEVLDFSHQVCSLEAPGVPVALLEQVLLGLLGLQQGGSAVETGPDDRIGESIRCWDKRRERDTHRSRLQGGDCQTLETAQITRLESRRRRAVADRVEP